MDASALMSKIIAYGADEAGIADRFCGNDELYDACFRGFLEDEHFPSLEEAIYSAQYKRAFDDAHALKGLSGNLGLTAFYEAICVLVESLRAESYAGVRSEYAEVRHQFLMLQKLLDEDAPEPPVQAPAEPDLPDKPEEPAAEPAAQKSARVTINRFTVISAAALITTALLLFILFKELTDRYESNVLTESADHLSEINTHIGNTIEDSIEDDWRIAYTLGAYFGELGPGSDDARILKLLDEFSAEWDLSNVVILTEDGGSIGLFGLVRVNDQSSEMVVDARRYGGYMEIVDSSLLYTVPIETEAEYGGSRIVAVCIARDMDSLFASMNLSSFGGQAFMYLTDDRGMVICRLAGGESIDTFNVTTLFEDGSAVSIRRGDLTISGVFDAETPAVFVIGGNYVVSAPIDTRQQNLRLFYFAPEEIVNRTMKSFSYSVTLSSLIVIVVFAILAVVAFGYIIRLRKKQFDTALIARDRMFNLLVKKSSTALCLFKLNADKPLFMSENSEAVTGYTAPALRMTEAGFALHDGNGADMSAMRAVNGSLCKWDGKSVFYSSYIKNEASASPSYFEVQLFPAGDAPDEFIGVAQDVTLLCEREEATKNALDMAERANKAKTRFLSNMSHDIRTPMNAIVNMTDFALNDIGHPDKLREHLLTIRESSDHLLMLINDVLDMSRIESGSTVIEARPFDLRAEINRLAGIITPLCNQKLQTFFLDIDGLSVTSVVGDQVKVSQILMNLLSNASKFTPRNGGVRLSVTEMPSVIEERVTVRFVVEDTGIGISKSFVRHIFEPFAREDTRRVDGIQGTGLGLAICHSYVSAMGGAIRCESEPGEGSVFTVELTFGKTDARLPQKIIAPSWDVSPFAGLRCLLCEDNLTNQTIATNVLERLGFAVETVSDGREGVTAFERSAPGYYDVIYMDIQMPVMDGYDATVGIRHSAHAQARTIPIVAMSANVFIEDIEKAHIAGMDGYVGKPLNAVAITSETHTAIMNKRRL